MIRWLAIGLIVLVAAASPFASACGGDDATSGVASSSDPEIPAGAPLVDQQDLAFKPDTLTVTAAQVLYFKNSESAIHTVTIDGANLSGSMKRGTVFAWTPPGPGTYRLRCDFHAQMNGTITVQ